MYNTSIFNSRSHKRKTTEYDCVVSGKNLEKIFAGCSDFQTRRIDAALSGSVYVNVCWIDGLVSGADIADNVLRPLTEGARFNISDAAGLIKSIVSGAVYSYSVKQVSDMDTLVGELCHGSCALVFDSELTAVTFEVKSDKNRAVSEPTLEKSLKGAKDSFVEVLRVNTALLRRRISNPKLKIIETQLGRKSATNIALAYCEGIASPDTVRAAAERLAAIDIDAVLSVGDVEHNIIDNRSSPFPQLLHTERPDRFAMYLMDGRVGILIDGIPVGLVLPVSFTEFLKVIGDRNMNSIFSGMMCALRFLSIILSALLPALYVAIAMYHQEMIPTRLLMSIVEAKRDVPFSTALEIFGMLLAFSMLQEAGLRLPDPVGDTVSIIGALIVGQSAVEARIVSPFAIIVVAISGIACYTLPSQDLAAALRITRLLLLLSAIFAGMYGIAICTCLVLLHLSGIESFGVNYTAPLSTGGLFRMFFPPRSDKNKLRDPLLNTPDRRRQK